MLKIENLVKSYKGRRVVNGVNLEVNKSEIVGLLGPNGAGKTTTFYMAVGLVAPDEGRIFFNDKDINKFKPGEVTFLRRKIGMVFQDFRLLANRTAYENVAFAMEVSGAPSDVIREKVLKILNLVGLKNKVDSFPAELSGGEAQRVAIARALVFSPRLLIADEPTGNLDPNNAWEITQLLLKINKLGTTVLLATHNRDIVDAIHKRVISLKDGKLVSDRRKGKYKE